jgi:hypothetical protein
MYRISLYSIALIFLNFVIKWLDACVLNLLYISKYTRSKDRHDQHVKHNYMEYSMLSIVNLVLNTLLSFN